MTYILLTNEEIVNLSEGKEVYCSVNGTDFALMLEHAYEDTYLKTKKEVNDD